MIDVVLANGFSRFSNSILCLALTADEEDLLVFTGKFTEEIGCLIEALNRFFEVNNVDPAFVLHEVRLHFWVPFAGLVSVMNASVYHFVNEFVNHWVYVSSLDSGWLWLFGKSAAR